MSDKQKGDHIEKKEQGPVTVTITQWNAEQGYGFVFVDGQRVFVHTTAINPEQKRRADLRGMRLVVKREDIKQGDKGLKAMDAFTEEEFNRQETGRREKERQIEENRTAVEQAVRALGEGWQLGKKEEGYSGVTWELKAPDNVASSVSGADSVNYQVGNYRYRLEQVARQEQDNRAREYLKTLLERVEAAVPQYQAEIEKISELQRREREWVEIQKRANERFEQEKPKEISSEKQPDSREGRYHAIVSVMDRHGRHGMYDEISTTGMATDRYGAPIYSTQLTPDERSYEVQTVKSTKCKLLSGDDVRSDWEKEENHRREIYKDVGVDTTYWYGESNQRLNALGIQIADSVLPTLNIPADLQERVRSFMLKTGSISLNQPARILEKAIDSSSPQTSSNTAEDIARRDHDIDAFAALQERSRPSVLRSGDEVSIALSRNLQPQIYDQENGSMAYPIFKIFGSYNEQYLLAWTRDKWRAETSMRKAAEKHPPFSAEQVEQKREEAWRWFVNSERSNQSYEVERRKREPASSQVPPLPQPKVYFAPLSAMAYPGHSVNEQGICTVEWFLDNQEAQRSSEQALAAMQRRFGVEAGTLRRRMECLQGENAVTDLAEIGRELAVLESQTTLAGFYEALAKLVDIENKIKADEQRVTAGKQQQREQVAEQHWPEIQAAIQEHQGVLARYIDNEYGVPMPYSFAALKEGHPIGRPVEQLDEWQREDKPLTSLPLPYGTLHVYHHYRYKGEQGARRRDTGWYVYIRMEAEESSAQPQKAVETKQNVVTEKVEQEAPVAAPPEEPSQPATADQIQGLLSRFGSTTQKKKGK